MGMRIGGAPQAPQASQSSVAKWQAAMPKPQAPSAPVASKPTATLGNKVNTFA
jgi:hypothetical protein